MVIIAVVSNMFYDIATIQNIKSCHLFVSETINMPKFGALGFHYTLSRHYMDYPECA